MQDINLPIQTDLAKNKYETRENHCRQSVQKPQIMVVPVTS